MNLKSEKSKNPRENREFQRSIVENIETQSTNYSKIIDRLFTVRVSDKKKLENSYLVSFKSSGHDDCKNINFVTVAWCF